MCSQRENIRGYGESPDRHGIQAMVNLRYRRNRYPPTIRSAMFKDAVANRRSILEENAERRLKVERRQQ